MKSTFKVFGIIALVAIIGFSFAACDNGTTDDGGKTLNFRTFDSLGYGSKTIALAGSGYEGALTPEEADVIKSLTKDDIVFTPDDVATIDSVILVNENSLSDIGIRPTVSILKSGTVTVSIKDKGGYKFVANHDSQLTFTKE